MLLDQAGPARQRQDVVVIDTETLAVLGRHGDVAGHLAAADVVDQLLLLGAELLAQDGPKALLQGRLEDVELVRVDRAGHDIFAQPVGAVDQHGIGETGLGVDGEHDAGGGQVRAHHLLDADRQADAQRVETLVHAVGNGAVGVERGETALAGFQQGGRSLNIQIGFLLAGKAGVGQVLGRGAGAHRDIHRAIVSGRELFVSREDGRLQARGQLGVQDRLPGGQAAPLQVGDVPGIEPIEDVPEPGRDAGVLDKIVIGRRRDGETIRHPDAPGRQFPDHLAEGRVLAADQRHILDADVLEPENFSRLSTHLGHACLLPMSGSKPELLKMTA